MPALLIKDLSPELHRKLKAAAAREHRSMTRQALVLLEQALHMSDDVRPLPPPFRGRFPLTDKIINEAKRMRRR